jgi:multisubunit Na+/H+ antiporter MnhC subunit
MMAWILEERVMEAVGWGLVHSVWELTLVALLVWGILCAVPRELARWRYGMGLMGMGVMVVCVAGTV